MKTRFRLIYRGERGRQFYCVESETGKRFSLKTKDRDAAEQIVAAKNQAIRQPNLNRQIAKAYLSGTDAGSEDTQVPNDSGKHALSTYGNRRRNRHYLTSLSFRQGRLGLSRSVIGCAQFAHQHPQRPDCQ
jgi:hypothetical protein